METSSPGPSRLDRTVGVLAKAVGALWVGGVVLLLANTFFFDENRLYLVALGALRSGFLLALVILVTILGSVVLRSVRRR